MPKRKRAIKNIHGKCVLCGKSYPPTKAQQHLHECITNAASKEGTTKTEGLVVRIDPAGRKDGIYWLFLAVPKDTSLTDLDKFLRGIWLECCGHLSSFRVGHIHYGDDKEFGDRSMDEKLWKAYIPGVKMEYDYDMGSTTRLMINVIEILPVCEKNEITVLMRNDPPPYECKNCQKAASRICAFCSATVCASCETHDCEEAEYGSNLMNLANSPRAGICGYEG